MALYIISILAVVVGFVLPCIYILAKAGLVSILSQLSTTCCMKQNNSPPLVAAAVTTEDKEILETVIHSMDYNPPMDAVIDEDTFQMTAGVPDV
ncbi:hypothetical protein QR680_000449 [Steinernema hermaphroditum]|uniref:Uncharacterized protein n=1 Tax=Steinernema hermaphroditum TaxID=289476 RepID=A0AA39GUM9_9BILA|nr:hypothetical protein QR680_000449 [Steinernema hermaphroditum]